LRLHAISRPIDYCHLFLFFSFFFFTDTAPTEIYTLSLHDALPIWGQGNLPCARRLSARQRPPGTPHRDRAERQAGHGDGGVRQRSEEHTSELQSRGHLVCRLLLEKKKKKK